jgi:hypothetical protein
MFLFVFVTDFGSILFHGYDAWYYINDIDCFSLDKCYIPTKIPIHAITVKDHAKAKV